MPESQKVEQTWETPPPDEIVSLSAQHVAAMETMEVDEVWQQAGMHHVLLRTVGRKSGKEHKVALPSWRDADGHRIVVASFAGSKDHPSWFLNLEDTKANPEVLIKSQEGSFWSVPEILDGDDYDRNWEQLNADRAWYQNYQQKTDRRIPLVRLPETRPA